MLIYKITNKINGHIYIGQTVRTLRERLNGHWKERRSNRPVSLAFLKHGKDAFTTEILQVCETMEELNKAEVHYITLFDCIAPKGYNVLPGGRNSKHTEITKAKMALKATGRPGGFKKHTEESKRLLSKAHTGKKVSAETKVKISQAVKGDKNPFFGKKHTEAALAKMRQPRKTQRA